jgi:hypothetical protein
MLLSFFFRNIVQTQMLTYWVKAEYCLHQHKTVDVLSFQLMTRDIITRNMPGEIQVFFFFTPQLQHLLLSGLMSYIVVQQLLTCTTFELCRPLEICSRLLC